MISAETNLHRQQFYPKNSEGEAAHVISIMDYPVGDPAQADISGLITNWFGTQATVTWFAVDDYSAIEVGFNLATRKVIHGSRIHPFTVVLGNAAPRALGNKNLEASTFVTFKLKNGIRVFTTLNQAGEEISLLGLSQIEGAISPLKMMRDGTQFRSAFLPEYAARYYLASSREDSSNFYNEDNVESLEDIVDLETDLRAEFENLNRLEAGIKVVHVDNFGNLKLSLVESDPDCPSKVGDSFDIEIEGVRQKVTRGKHLGDVEGDDQLCLYPGSSCIPGGHRLMEICLIGGSAAHKFRNENGLARFGGRVRAGQLVRIS